MAISKASSGAAAAIHSQLDSSLADAGIGGGIGGSSHGLEFRPCFWPVAECGAGCFRSEISVADAGEGRSGGYSGSSQREADEKEEQGGLMLFRPNTPYYPIPGSQPEATFGAVMEMLLKTRLKLNLENTPSGDDEDVNTYLAGVLVSYIDPIYLKAISDVLSQYDIDVYQAVEKAEDRYHAYWIYKVNADDLLVSIGLFQRTRKGPPEGELGRIRRYYTFASEYQRRIYGKPTAVAQIQMKLAQFPRRYLTILEGARKDYLHLIERVSPGELDAFQESVQALEKDLQLKYKQDELLDAYSAWLKGSRDPDSRKRLLTILEELQQLDCAFEPKAILSALGCV